MLDIVNSNPFPFEVRGTHCSPFPSTHIVTFYKNSMIRGQPTLIPMSEKDVQDVRDMVANGFPVTSPVEDENLKRLLSQLKARGLGKPMSDADVRDMVAQGLPVTSPVEDEKKLKARRLGLNPGVFNNAFESSHLKFIDKSHRIIFLSQSEQCYIPCI
jgi:hypothetical protein